MANENTTKSSDLRIFWLFIIISVVSGIWGFFFPGKLALRTGIEFLGIRIASPFILMALLFISLIILIFGFIKDWEFKIGSNITIHSRELLIVGSILMLFAAFSFCGVDPLLFVLYYYEILVFTIYWIFSMTILPSIVLGASTVIFILLGVVLIYRKSDLKLPKWTISYHQSSNFLTLGVISLLLTMLVGSLTQTDYTGFQTTIEGLPFGALVSEVLVGYYQNLEFYFYPLVLFICGCYFFRIALSKPQSRIVASDAVESFSKKYQIVQGLSLRFLLLMLIITVAFFILIGIQYLVGLDQAFPPLFDFQTELFRGILVLPGITIGAVPLFTLAFVLPFIIYAPRAIRPFIDDRVIRYAMRRLLTLVPIFIGVSMISYALMVATGNPIELMLQSYPFPAGRMQYRELLTRVYGLDAAPQIQWFNWFFHFIMGDMGDSLFGGADVAVAITQKIGPTLLISVFPLILTLVIAVPVGVYAALKQYSKTDNAISVFVAIGLSIPIFVFIIILILLFAFYIPILPSSGMELDESTARSVDAAYTRAYFDTFIQYMFTWEIYDLFFHLIIPIVAITTISLVLYVRLVRSGLLEVIRQDYILSSMAYGFPQRTIIWRHAIQNVLIPVITYIGLSIGGLLGGAPITETTLGWPGLGRYAVGRFLQYDYPVVMGIIMVTAVLILLANLFTDILYTIIDPRVSL
ncbi:MAG: ABC transporter permease [Promethearchaeota archaeon]